MYTRVCVYRKIILWKRSNSWEGQKEDRKNFWGEDIKKIVSVKLKIKKKN